MHTPTPYRVVHKGAGHYRVRGKIGPTEVDVATVHGGPDEAAFIVTACNAHAKLVAALRAARTYFMDVSKDKRDEAHGTLEIINDTLAGLES